MQSTAAKRAKYLRPIAAVATSAALLMGMFPTAFADSSILSVPVNATPFDGSHVNVGDNVNMTWTAASDASSSPITYDWEVATSLSSNADGSFQSPSASGSTNGLTATAAFAGAGSYWWHVRAHDAAGNIGTWSNYTGFTVDAASSTGGTGSTSSSTPDTTPPPVPTNSLPVTGTTLSLSSLSSLTWTAVTDASSNPVTYDYEVSGSASANADGSFTTTLAHGSGLTAATASLSLAATTTGTVYWHVRAVDSVGNKSAWSTTSSVTISTSSGTGGTGGTGSTTPSVIPWPGNFWPYNGAVITSAAFTHAEWTEELSSVTNLPVTYNYEVATNPAVNADGSFVTPVFSQNGIASTSLATTGTPEGTYYWHVQAQDALGNKSGWSTYSKITVNNSATGSFGLGLGSSAVGTSTAIYPTDGATITQSQDTHVDWTAASGTQPLTYVYQYSWSTQTNADGDLTFPSYTSGTLTSPTITIFHPQGDAPGVYHWHVRAIDPSGNVGPWSSLFTFTVVADGSGSTTGSTGGTGSTTGSTGGTGSTTGSVLGNATSTVSNLIVVTPNDLLGTTSIPVAQGSSNWFFFDDTTGTINNSLGSFVTGPGTPPLGTGSVQLTASSTDRLNLATYQFGGIKLSDIAGLSFSTFAHDQASTSSSTPFMGADPYLQFNVDFGGTGTSTFQGRLAYLPRLNGTVATGTWQTWDAINGGNANWLFTGSTWPGGSTLGTTPMTWSQILAAYPNATTLTGNSFLGFRVGEPYPNGFTANVDNFKIALNNSTTTTVGTTTQTMATTTTTTFDFDPATSTATTTNGNGSGSGAGGGSGSQATGNGGTGTEGQFVGNPGGGSGSTGGTGSVLGNSTGPSTGTSGNGTLYLPAGSNTGGSVLGAATGPTGSVLAAATAGTPNTGEGGNAILNMMILVLAAVLIAGGITVLFTWRERYDV